jgi:hypothetical protein
MSHNSLSAGDWVEVLSKEEILKTLDERGQLEGMPFMPQMFEYCGKRLQVFKRSHKTCDTVNDYKGRRMKGAVHLEGIRCDGRAYGGCQALCLIFWKESWLRKVDGVRGPIPIEPASVGKAGSCTEAGVFAGTQSRASEGSDGPTYVCQATQVPAATVPLPWWEMSQYLEDYTSGNASLWRIAKGFLFMGYRGLINAGIGLGKPLRWFYDRVQSLWGGIPYPRRQGTVPHGTKTPTGVLNLRVGEMVRVRTYNEILATLDETNRNRGLYFDAEMVPFCGKTYRVLECVTMIVHEKTGKMQHFKNPCIILEGVACESRYSECRLFCPRAIYSYWREIWLERIPVDNPERSKLPNPVAAAF